MAFSVDWLAKVFTIPQSDLTLLSGNNYSLSLVDVHKELRRLEWNFTDGLWAPRIANWYETVTLSGVPKTPSVEVINDYTFDFTGSNYNVILTDYDNNLVDVYIPSNGISILGNNSVGKQTIVTGSGLSAGEQQQLTDIESSTNYHTKIINGAKELIKISTSWYLIIYDTGEVSGGVEILRKKQTDAFGNDITDLVAGVLAAELENSV